MKDAQAKISEAIKTNPEMVISKAIAFNPQTAAIVNDCRKVSGPASGVAASALKYALRGKTNDITAANIIKFASGL